MSTETKLSRREFIKDAAIASAAVAASGVLGAAPAAAAPVPDKWDKEADFVVVGTGCAGLAAAIEAADAKAKVIVLEKMDVAGGTTAMSGGIAAIPMQQKINDAIEYFVACGREKAEREMITVWAKEAVTLKDWLSQFGKMNVTPRPGYHDMFKGWDSIESVGPVGSGPELIDDLVKAAKSKGVEILLETPATELIATPAGEVVGVKAESKGAVLNIKAKKATMLAAGGIQFNEELKLQFLRSWPKYGTGSPGTTGDGLKMGQALGAAIWKTAEGCGRPAIKIPEYKVAYGFGLLAQPFIGVNKYGKRFAREDLSYDAFHMALDTFDATKREFTNIPAFAIFDEEQRPKAMVGSAPRVLHGLPAWSADNSAEIAKGWITKADTIAELATKLKIDPAVLQKTVDTYNGYAAAGKDPDFGRTAGFKAVKTAPFYGIAVYAGYYGTWAGLKINTQAQVINVWGKVIPRLYAAGENAIGSLSFHYPSGGNCVADGLAFGRIAGRTVAAQKPWDAGA